MQAFISEKLHVNQFWALIFNTFTLKNTVLQACPWELPDASSIPHS